MIALLAVDIAGTTVAEGGTVYRVLADTVRDLGAQPTSEQLETWMGASKREAIDALLTASNVTHDDAMVDAGFADFRHRLIDAYRNDPPAAFPGVTEMIGDVRSHGIRVALTTGFDREVTDALLDAIGWSHGVVDTVVGVDDVPAGRPAPYLIFAAMMRTDVRDVRQVLTAGDTVRDIEAGRNAGAGTVVAVTTGEVPRATLEAAAPTMVLNALTDVPDAVDLFAR